jgi:hypothetical protein
LKEFPLYINVLNYRLLLPYYKSLSQTWSNCLIPYFTSFQPIINHTYSFNPYYIVHVVITYTRSHASLFINNFIEILTEFSLYINVLSYRLLLPYYKSLSQTWSNCPRPYFISFQPIIDLTYSFNPHYIVHVIITYTHSHAPLFINNFIEIFAKFSLYINMLSYRLLLSYYKSLSQTWSNCLRPYFTSFQPIIDPTYSFNPHYIVYHSVITSCSSHINLIINKS